MLKILLTLWFVVSPGMSLLGSELPRSIVEELASPNFRQREAAQVSLLSWSRARPSEVMADLLKQSRVASDPEVRSRCLSVLKSLVTDQYLKEGEGFVGIALNDEEKIIPGDPKLRQVIRILQVQIDSPGEKAGLRVNDLIVGMDHQIWYGVPASPQFREKVLETKPGTTIELQVLRDARLETFRVTLGRKLVSPSPLINGLSRDLEAMENAAKDAYFERWLKLNPVAR